MSTLTKNNAPSSAVREIDRLHAEIETAAKTTLPKAIRIGELLTRQKGSLQHGEWLPWIEKNLPFTRATASNYIRCFERRDELKCKSLLHLADAYRLLSPMPEPEDDKPDALTEIETRISSDLTELEMAREALIEIRDKELWREKFNTFSDYVSTLNKNYADFLLSAVREVRITEIILDQSIYCRADGVPAEVVAKYAKAMRSGAVFPAIDVFDCERGMVLTDGWIRVHAAKRNGAKTILATIHTGRTFKDAVRHSLGSNAKHGLSDRERN